MLFQNKRYTPTTLFSPFRKFKGINMTVYEIYVHGEFYEAWEVSDVYKRVVQLQSEYGDCAVKLQEKLIDFQDE